MARFSPRAITGGAATAPILILFGLNAVDELDRSAFGILTPTIRDDVRSRQPGDPGDHRRGRDHRPRLPGTGGLLRGSGQPGADRRHRRGGLGRVHAGDGPGADGRRARDRPFPERTRSSGQRPDPPVVDRRLLRPRGPHQRLRLPRRGQRRGPLRRAAHRGGAVGVVRLAGALPHLLDPHGHPRRLRRGQAPRARPRGARTPRHGGQRGAGQHRGSGAVVRRVLAHLQRGPHPPANLHLAALPRRPP